MEAGIAFQPPQTRRSGRDYRGPKILITAPFQFLRPVSMISQDILFSSNILS
jgi:hypothetical protein